MALLDLEACPICRTRGSLSRQTVEKEGRPYIFYECAECGSVLLWLGQDLWWTKDRWAYQKVGREDKVHLLKRPLTADDLWALLHSPQHSAHTGPQPRPGARAQARTSSPPAPARDRPPRVQPAQRRRGLGSPFLLVSVALILLCLVLSSAAMIGFSSLHHNATDVPRLTATLAPTETLTPTPLPTQTPSPTPYEPSPAVLQGITDYVATTGSHCVVGEVLNTTGSNLRLVEIHAAFYDGSGQLIASGSTFSELAIVEAGGTAPFKLVTLDPPPSLHTYKLRVNHEATSQTPLRLEVLDHAASVAPTGWYHVSGQVRNPSAFAVKSPEVVATFYDAADQVLRVEMTLAQVDPLLPGQSSPFEVVLVDPPPDVVRYTLQTEASRE
jgi:hypothetical protein